MEDTMLNRPWALAPLVFIACNGGDSDTSGDTDSDGAAAGCDWELEVRAAAPGASWVAVANQVQFEEDGLTDLGVYEASTFNGTAAKLCFPDTFPAEETAPLGDGDETGAAFLVYAFDDTDGSGARDAGEPVAAGSIQMLAWIESGEDDSDDPLDQEFAIPGWNAVAWVLDEEEEFVLVDPADGFDLDRLLPLDEATMTADVEDGVFGLSDRVATLSWAEVDEGGFDPLPGRPIDTQLEDPITLTVADPLDEARIIVNSDLPLPLGLEFPVVYVDGDADESFDANDEIVGNFCLNGESVAFLYLPGDLDLMEIFYASFLDLHLGWSAVQMGDESFVLIDGDDAVEVGTAECSGDSF
jgi:hypothetical protein